MAKRRRWTQAMRASHYQALAEARIQQELREGDFWPHRRKYRMSYCATGGTQGIRAWREVDTVTNRVIMVV
jgi:hypothetical protein